MREPQADAGPILVVAAYAARLPYQDRLDPSEDRSRGFRDVYCDDARSVGLHRLMRLRSSSRPFTDGT